MNITPWIQFLIREGIDPSEDDAVLFDCSKDGHGVQVKAEEWFGYRELRVMKTKVSGVSFETARAIAGGRHTEYAWDELNAWNYEKGSLGYYVKCNKFEVSYLSDSFCFMLYNLFVHQCCLAHTATQGTFPLMAKGVNLGYLQPDGRRFYDANGFPNRTWLQG